MDEREKEGHIAYMYGISRVTAVTHIEFVPYHEIIKNASRVLLTNRETDSVALY